MSRLELREADVLAQEPRAASGHLSAYGVGRGAAVTSMIPTREHRNSSMLERRLRRCVLGAVAVLAVLGGAPSLKAQTVPVDPPGKRHPTGYDRNVDPALKAASPLE